ncbi:MAG TPA: DinB family protein [Blastocatellia bacterium]|nr:DinB family protein [Blastocatellia bacterium]
MQSDHGQSTSGLIADNIMAVGQGIELIERLDDALYTRLNRALSLGSVGGHVRHCIDFYQSFLTGVRMKQIDYDRRERDERIEKNRLFATARLNQIIEGLSSLPRADEQSGVEVLLEGSSTLPNDSGWSRSSIRRELQFLLSHTIHHYALMALALRIQGFQPDEEFGVAPSTLKYWRKSA